MSPNPYNPPQSEGPLADASARPLPSAFLLAAVGAWLASAYWAVMTLLIALGVAAGAGSGTALLFPCVLIFLYASRGYRLFKGSRKAATSILWLHVIGAIMAVVQAKTGVLVVMQVVKVGIHVFGGIAAALALRASSPTGDATR